MIAKTPSQQKKATALQRELLVLLGILVVLNVGAALLGWWPRVWWALLFVDFVLVVRIAERLEPHIPYRRQTLFKRALAVGFPVLVLVAWELIVRADILNPRWFPPPTTIAAALWDLIVSYDRFNETSLLGRPWLIPQVYPEEGWAGVRRLFTESHVLATLLRVLFGFLIGASLGLVVGMAMGLNKTVRMMLDATMSAVYVLPKIAIFPLMMLIFPDPFGEGPKIAVVAISAFFLVAISTMTGVHGIDKVYLEAGKNYGASGLRMLRHVIIPGALPIIFSGFRLALGTALIVVVAVEFIRSQTGVGFLIFYYWQILVTEKMYAGLFVVMVLGVSLTFGLQWLEHKVMPWRR
ncbi:MAG: ABC transporter permease [Trueperaceae bacterium]|nr:ABC transporter permease [Trueperaceae bacterium]